MSVDAVIEICNRLAAEDSNSAEATDVFLRARRASRATLPLATDDAIEAAAQAAVAHLQGLGPLQPFLADPAVNEIMVNNGGDVWLERCGAVVLAGRLGPDVVPRLIERILSPLGRRLDRLSPIVDARLVDGSRVCAVIPPIAVDGPCFTLRRFSVSRRPLCEFASAEVVELLTTVVMARCNVLISGATSSGKTSLLNALVSVVVPGERIITLEDTAELRLDTAHVLRLEARPATVDGVTAIDMTDLVRTSLRLRPDRLVIGEIRGGEVIDMLQALNTGHDGSMATLHANSSDDAVRRIEALVVQHAPSWSLAVVSDHVRSSIDVIVHVARQPGGERRVHHVLELARPGSSEAPRQLSAGDSVLAALQRRRT